MGMVAFITAALVIVLSVFNGLEDLLRGLNNAFDPEIKIVATKGKSFECPEEFLSRVKATEGVAIVTEVIEDYAYVRYRDANQIVTMKGVSDNFIDQKRIPKENLIEGELKFREGDVNYAVMGIGVQYTLSIAPGEVMFPMQFYYINNVKSVGLDPSKLYTKRNITPGGVFSIVSTIDANYVLVPLNFAQDLLGYGNKRTSLEIKVKEGADAYAVERSIQEALGPAYLVLNHEEQHKDLYKLLRMEKLFAFLALSLLLLIGSINIFFSLMMLAIDKKKDISILAAMGAPTDQIRAIFLTEGALIAGLGTTVGLLFGGTLCWLQMEYGFVSMGMEASITQGYPVLLRAVDFVAVLVIVSVITILISFYPAKLASKFAAVRNL